MSNEELIELSGQVLRQVRIITRELKKIEGLAHNFRMKALVSGCITVKPADFGEQLTFSDWLEKE